MHLRLHKSLWSASVLFASRKCILTSYCFRLSFEAWDQDGDNRRNWSFLTSGLLFFLLWCRLHPDASGGSWFGVTAVLQLLSTPVPQFPPGRTRVIFPMKWDKVTVSENICALHCNFPDDLFAVLMFIPTKHQRFSESHTTITNSSQVATKRKAVPSVSLYLAFLTRMLSGFGRVQWLR